MGNSSTKVSEKDVRLVEGTGTKKLLGDLGGQYWHIYHNDIRVGRVFISLTKKDRRTKLQPFITVEINKKNREVGIGTLVFRMAAESSEYDKVFAEMRKSNIASHTAASRAGYVQDSTYKGNQLRLVWKRAKR